MVALGLRLDGNIIRNTAAAVVKGAVFCVTADIQGAVRGMACKCIFSGSAFLLHKVRAAGLFAAAGTWACNFDVRAAAAVICMVCTVCNVTS